MMSCSGALNKVKINGPATDPCGTSQVRATGSERTGPMATDCVLPSR